MATEHPVWVKDRVGAMSRTRNVQLSVPAVRLKTNAAPAPFVKRVSG